MYIVTIKMKAMQLIICCNLTLKIKTNNSTQTQHSVQQLQ